MAVVNPNQPIHPDLDNKLSVKVQNQLPDFVKQDHNTFVAFLEAYYEYMEQTGKPYEIIGNLNHYADLGKTTDEFLQYFKKTFGEDIPEAIFKNSNKPFVLKRLRDFYRAKGSQKSFEFFFRLLNNEEIDIYYPSTDMLRTSDGRYDKSQIVRSVDTSGNDDIFKLVGNLVTGQSTGATAVVESILNENIGSYVVSTIFLSGTIGTFTDEVISDGTYSFPLGGMIIDTNISVAGNNYSVNDIIPISGGGALSSGATLRVKELTTGIVMKVIITNGGTGYSAGDRFTIDNTNALDINGRTMSLRVKSVDGNGTITELDLENTGRGYSSLPTISGGSGTGAILTPMGWNVGGVHKLQIVNNGFGFTGTPTLDFTTHGDGDALGTAVIGFYEPMFNVGFSGENGFLSSSKYLQDSNYYQLFSYVITSSETIDKWRKNVRRTVHPAGLALFGKYQLVADIETTFSITGVPDRTNYTIIFHDGTVDPATVLDLKIDSCEGHIVYVTFDEDYRLTNEAVDDTEDFGLITNIASDGEDYKRITELPTAYTLPTDCQIYEVELGEQRLVDGVYDDYLFVYLPATRYANFGLLDEATNNPRDYGMVMEQQTIALSQLRLGPLRRTFDERKFKMQGGFGQPLNGVMIKQLQDIKVSEYIFFDGKRHSIGFNTTITQYLTGDESNALPPPV